MTYSRIAENPFSCLHPSHDRVVNATRRLYAQTERNLKEEDKERNLTWLGMLLCLVGGVMEVSFLRWLLN